MEGHNNLSILQGEKAGIPSCHVLDLFESHAKSMPTRNSPAVIDDSSGTTLSYLELDRDSSIVARMLYSFLQSMESEQAVCGGTPKQPVVGVYLAPSSERIVTLLALWKINVVFLPLDVSMPASRMKFIIQEASACAVISADMEHRFDEVISLCGELDIMCLDYYINLNREDGMSFNGPVGGNNISFAPEETNPVLSIFYTSGSTGTPKGVPLRTSNWLNLVTSYWGTFPFQHGDIGCHKTPIAFAESLHEILICVLGGVPLVVLSRESASNPEVLLQKIVDYNISHMGMVPSMVGAVSKLCTESPRLISTLAPLRVLECNSETFDPALASKIRSILPEKCLLVNCYGSTEDTCCVTEDIFQSVIDIEKKTVSNALSMGKPLLNTTVYILDGKKRIVEQGHIGTIYVCGSNVASGYVKDSLSDAFVANPFTRSQNEPKMYNTGDLGFILDGRLFFAGRTDSLVKVRGQRVSCTELERVIAEMEHINKVVVMPIVDSYSLDTVKLVAFCTRNLFPKRELRELRAGFFADERGYSGSSIDSDSSLFEDGRNLDDATVMSSVEAYCRLNLPSYMVPTVVMVEEFPLKSLSGKIDREALKQQYLNSFDLDEESSEPGGDDEILRIISKELDVPTSVLQKNMAYKFMDLGGNSLSAVSAVMSLRARKYKVSVDMFIKAPISELLRLRHESEIPSRASSSYSCTDSIDSIDIERGLEGRFNIKSLGKIREQEQVKRLMALSFTQKNPLDVIIGTSLCNFMKFLNSIWMSFLEDEMSFVVIDRQNKNTVVAASLNLDMRTVLQPEITMEEVMAINEAVEKPVKIKLAQTGGRWMDALLNAVDVSLPNVLSLPLLIMMENHLISLAQHLDLDGIVTVNSHPVTMAIAEQRFDYRTEHELHVKSYQYGGRRPFCQANDDYVIKCMTKYLK